MVVLKDCAHFLHDEKPIETTKYILRFLEDIDARSTSVVSEKWQDFEITHLMDENENQPQY